MDIKDLLTKLEQDYNSCQLPNWTDPKTVETLSSIWLEIQLGNYSISKFHDFLDKKFNGDDFAKKCELYTSCITMYYDSIQRSYIAREKYNEFLEKNNE